MTVSGDLKNTFRKYWFPIILVIGLIAYPIVRYMEDIPYRGPVTQVRGVVVKTTFVAGGTMTGRSFVRIVLQDGRSYRMPLDEMVPIDQGEHVILRVPSRELETGANDVSVLEYCVSSATYTDCDEFK